MSEATLERGREEMGALGRRRSQDGSEGPKPLGGFLFVLCFVFLWFHSFSKKHLVIIFKYMSPSS